MVFQTIHPIISGMFDEISLRLYGFLCIWVVRFLLLRILQEEDFRKSGNSIMDRMREVGSKMDALEESE